MKKFLMLFAVIMVTVVTGWAQQPAAQTPAAAPQAGKSPVPDGVMVKVEAKQTVETKKAKVGDPVKLEAVEDGKDANGKTVKGPDGRPAVPRKTKFLAKVSSAKASDKGSKDAKLSLVVVSATFPDGKTMPFLGVVLGPFEVSTLSTGIDTRGGGAASKDKLGLDTPQVPSGIQGVDIKIDPQLGTVLVAPMNFSLDNGTDFHVRYVDPAAHPAEPQPPAK